MVGSLLCWGSKSNGQTLAPAGPFTQVAAGDGFACALTVMHAGKNSIKCWGKTAPSKLIRKGKPLVGTFNQISAGAGVCVINGPAGRAGKVTCWRAGNPRPTDLFTQVSASEAEVCGLKTGGSSVCWSGWAVPKSEPGPFTQVATGSSGFMCGLSPSGRVPCWGFAVGNYKLPATYTQISAGWYELCGLGSDGSITCRGSGRNTAPPGSFKAVVAGQDYNCAMRANGSAFCWLPGRKV